MPGSYPRRRYRRRNLPGRRRRRGNVFSTANRYVGAARTAYGLARTAWSGVKYLKGLVNSEMYKYDLDVAPTTNTTGTVTHISAVAVGDGDNQRTGNSILCRNVYIRGTLIKAINAVSTFVRMLLIQDKQQGADTVPTIADVLEAVAVNAPLNSNSVGKYSILKDQVFMLNANNPQDVINCYIPMQSHIRFNGTAGTDIQKNGIYVMFFSNEATDAPTVAYSSRVSYHDN